ncbi:GTP-binding protein EngA, partial [Bacillus sp. SG-1]
MLGTIKAVLCFVFQKKYSLMLIAGFFLDLTLFWFNFYIKIQEKSLIFQSSYLQRFTMLVFKLTSA